MNSRDKTDRWIWFGGAAIVLLTLAAHAPGLSGQFLEWDDTTHVTQYPAIRALTLDNLRIMFTGYTAKLYLPLTWLSFAVDYQIWGREPFGYHFTNLLLHLANTVLVLTLVVRLLRDRVDHAQLIALITAAIFGLHPLRVESVAWVTERKDVLFAFFFLAALHAYLTWVVAGRRIAYWGCFVLFVAAVLSKSTAVTFPLVALLLDYFWKRRVAWPEKIPFFAVSAIIAGATVVAQASGSGETVASPEVIPLWARPGLVGFCSVFYVGKFFWPFHLSALYPTFEEMEWRPIHSAMFILMFVGILVAVFVLRRRAPLLLPAWLFYLVTLSPTIGIVPVGAHVVADRFSYLPLIGLALPLSVGIVAFAGKGRAVAVAVVIAVLIGLGVLTAQRAAVWSDTEKLFTNALEENPQCYPALVNLTVYCTGNKRFDEAITYGKRAVAVAPNGLVGRKNLAWAYIDSGRYREAVAALRPAVDHGIDDPSVWRALNKCFTELGDTNNAAATRKKLDRFPIAPSQTQNQ